MTHDFVVGTLHSTIGSACPWGPALHSVADHELALAIAPDGAERRSQVTDARRPRSTDTTLVDLVGRDPFHAWWPNEMFRHPTGEDVRWATPRAPASGDGHDRRFGNDNCEPRGLPPPSRISSSTARGSARRRPSCCCTRGWCTPHGTEARGGRVVRHGFRTIAVDQRGHGDTPMVRPGTAARGWVTRWHSCGGNSIRGRVDRRRRPRSPAVG